MYLFGLSGETQIRIALITGCCGKLKIAAGKFGTVYC
jgi:hypothetical protein